MTNLNCVTELTEFTPLSPEIKPAGVASLFSKIFKFSQVSEDQSEEGSRRASESNVNTLASTDETNTSTSNWSSNNISIRSGELVSTSISTSSEPFTLAHQIQVRTLPNVLRRVSNLLASRNKDAVAYNDTNLKKYWMPDSVSKECYECGEKFTAFRRRHHCRVCGQIFCSQCCNREVPGKIMRCSGNLRVCTYCCKVVLSYLRDTDLTVDLKALQDDLQSKFGNDIFDFEDNQMQDTANLNDDKNTTNEANKRKISVVYQEENFASSRSTNTTITQQNSSSKSESASLNSLLFELTRSDNALQLQDYMVDNMKCESCFTGSQLIDWLISQRKTFSRTHSLAIGQVLLDANWIECVGQSLSDFMDGPSLYRFCSAASNIQDENQEHSSFLSPEKTTRISRSGFHLDINITKNTAHISRHPTKGTNVKDRKKPSLSFGSDITEEVINDFSSKYLRLRELNSVFWASADESNLIKKDDELKTFSRLTESFEEHIQNTVNQLLMLEKLSLSWSDVVLSLADQALREIRIDFNKIDISDIRHYVQIKKLPGGERNDCRLIGGLVCSKNVAHRDMSTRLKNPRILLLQCAIVYQRMEGRLMSLEPVIMQEQEYLRHVVARITALEPNVILVHRNVSRLAQESLNARGITLVLNVKMSVMQRIARCTNADIVTSVDAHISTTQLGACRYFYTDKYVLEDGSVKNLMFFDDCAFPQLGCTIILRGASAVELKKLKSITSSLVFAKYNAKLEKSFLLDEFAKPPSVATFSFIGESEQKSVNMSCSNTEVDKETTNVHKVRRESMLDEPKEKAYSDNSNALKVQLENMKAECAHTADTTVEDEFSTAAGGEVDKSEKYEDDGGAVCRQNSFRKAIQNTVLSYSLFIQFNLPYLETTASRQCELRKYFPNEIFYSSYWNKEKKIEHEMDKSVMGVNHDVLTRSTLSIPKKKSVHPFVVAKLKDNVINQEVRKELSFYRASGGRLMPSSERMSSICRVATEKTPDTKIKTGEINFTDPRNHQRLSVLFCSFSHYSNNSPEFCVNPWTVTMDFYGCNDIPLGSFLEKYCFKTSYMCPSETCETPMLDHERRFVHDGGCLHVTLNELDSLPDKNNHQILLWSVCTSCKVSTPIVAMSNDTWNLSFAKYLELRFHAGQYTCRADTTKSCHHSLHHDYCQFFYHRNIVASFKYSDILRWEISLPQKVVEIHASKLQTALVLDEVKKWAIMGHEIFSSVLEKLCFLDTDNASCIQTVKKHLMKEQADFKSEVDDIQVLLINPTFVNDPKPENSQTELCRLDDKIVSMKKTVAKTIVNWDSILVKLDSKKRDDRQKNKSTSNDLVEQSSLTMSSTEEDISTREELDTTIESKRDFSTCSEDSDSLNLVAEINKNDDDGKISAKDGSIMSTDVPTHEIPNTLPQITSQEKISVKALISQLLPNTFQNHPSSLTNPISSEEHYLLNRSCLIPIAVHESEPSSAIAYALSTNYYQYALDDLMKTGLDQSSRNKREGCDRVSVNSCNEQQMGETEEAPKLESYECENGKTKSTKSSDAHHIEVNFADASTSFTVKVYFAQQFKEIRNLIFPSGEEAFMRSLSRCVHWAAHGGKSGSSFCKTKDDRFILKEMARLEIQPFLEFAPHYFNFIRTCCLSQQPTLLVKIVGVYYVKFRNSVTNQTFQSTLLVMENLFYMRDIIRKFDLKGSVRNRLVNTKNGHEGELVLLDENLINMTCHSPLYIYPHSKTVLIQAINNDVVFLASQSVMDYSLLVGLDETSQELVVGIIDYIRTFTWDKKLETMVKKSGILGGQGKLPTIISPDEYKNRFIAAMHKYFIAVPDQWHGFGRGINY